MHQQPSTSLPLPPSAGGQPWSLTPADLPRLTAAIRENIHQYVTGHDAAIEQILVAILCRNGHVLIEDVPGVGKTTLAKAFAQALGLSFSRIQFTPDLLPNDITGSSIYNQQTGTFEFRPGPLLSQFVLADEINRANPKTQSALLEAMEEGQVTVDGRTHKLQQPFIVMATQNPIEMDGTNPLPEAQLDRFLLRVRLGYPAQTDPDLEVRLIQDWDPNCEVGFDRSPVLPVNALQMVRAWVERVQVKPEVARYIFDLAEASRREPCLRLGMSPRAAVRLRYAAQAYAALQGRPYVTDDDVQQVFLPVIAHRLCLAYGAVNADGEDLTAEDAARLVLSRVPALSEAVGALGAGRGARR